MIFPAIMFVLLLLAMVLQEFMPILDFAYQARVFLMPTVFFVLALTVPYPVMLVFALLSGFMWDARYLMPDSDLAFGTSVLSFALLGSLVQGIRPLFQRGRWELPIVMVGLAVLFQLMAEYLFINFRRGDFYFPAEIWFKMLATSLTSMLMAPLLLILISRIARKCNYQLEYEQRTLRRIYGHQI